MVPRRAIAYQTNATTFYTKHDKTLLQGTLNVNGVTMVSVKESRRKGAEGKGGEGKGAEGKSAEGKGGEGKVGEEKGTFIGLSTELGRQPRTTTNTHTVVSSGTHTHR